MHLVNLKIMSIVRNTIAKDLDMKYTLVLLIKSLYSIYLYSMTYCYYVHVSFFWYLIRCYNNMKSKTIAENCVLKYK